MNTMKEKGNKIDLFNGNKLSGIKVHAHVDPPKGTGTNQLAFTPPNWRRWRRRFEAADSGFANGGADLVGKTGEASIVGGRWS